MSDAAAEDDVIARLKRDFYVKKGDALWRKRSIDRFEARFPERAMNIWNAKWADRPVSTMDKGRRGTKIDGRFWLVADLVRALETGVLPNEIPQDGNPYHDDIYIGEGPLAAALDEARAASGLKAEDLLVLSRRHDPFALDTPEGHRDAAWFREHLDRLVGDRRIHLHGFHYVLVSAGGVVKPNGEPYRNTHADDDWLADVAGKRARWLRYIDFDRIDDNRNDAPIIYRPEPPGRPLVEVGGSVGSYCSDEIASARIGRCRPFPMLYNFNPWQPYGLAFFGEKSSLDPVLRPLAERHRADMYLGAGELSDTLVWRMARDAVADGRPLIVFCFSDFDPAGMQMPISIGRKLQAFKTLFFPGLRGQVVPVALSLDHALEFRLPTTPVKDGEKRRDRWQQAYGPALFEAGLIESPGQAAQVEIDALAALRPAELQRIAEAAIAPYVDRDLPRRFATTEARWRRAAEAAVAAQVDEEAVAAIRERAEYAVGAFNDALEALRAAGADLDSLQGGSSTISPPRSSRPIRPKRRKPRSTSRRIGRSSTCNGALWTRARRSGRGGLTTAIRGRTATMMRRAPEL
jgi:hypothetical protein